MELRHQTLEIPVGLTAYVKSNKLSAPFKLLIALKIYSDGIIHKDYLDYDVLQKFLKYKTKKSIDNNLKRAIKLGWIGYNKNTGYLFPRSFITLDITHEGSYPIKSQRSARYDVETSGDLSSFLDAELLGHLSTRGKFVKRTETSTKVSLQGRYKYGWRPLAVRNYAKALKVSIRTASKWMNNGVKSNLIKRREAPTYIKYKNFQEQVNIETTEGNVSETLRKMFDDNPQWLYHEPYEYRTKRLHLRKWF